MQDQNNIVSTHTTADIIFFFFFNDTATTEIYTLSLHDALPIYEGTLLQLAKLNSPGKFHYKCLHYRHSVDELRDRKSTRLNSSHVRISYAVFCLKKKKTHRLVR